MTQEVQAKLLLLPDSPGCYLMKHEGEIIYVGKAVNLKNRVRSYFHSHNHTPKVAAMVSRIDDFDTILCDTNLEALILECNLIKLHKPYYNILLRDDKQYPYIRIDERESFPRVELVRRMEKDGARYFGPFIGATAVREVLEVLRRTFPLRTCRTLPQTPRRPCVHYEIGQCLAPCARKVDAKTYHRLVQDVISFLSGKTGPILSRLKEEMMEASRNLAFEKAALLRDRIRDVEGLLERQRAVSTAGGDRDVLALSQDGLDAMVEVLHVRGGRILGGDHFSLERAGDENPGDVLGEFLIQFYENDRMLPPEILLEHAPQDLDDLENILSQRRGAAVHLRVPQRGDKKALILMAQKNAREALEKRNARANRTRERTIGAAEALSEAIGLSFVPRRIEAFDISNTQGTNSVASMVVFINGEPAKKEYRHYRIKTVDGPNDFASMEEVLGRRFRRGLAEHAQRQEEEGEVRGGFGDLPDLILIDGGPQQLAFARRAMLAAGGTVPMFGLAERLDEIWLPDSDTSIYLDRHSPALHLIQRIRDEAHRFAITHHRALRGKSAVHSRLEDIPGIGPKRRSALLKHFKNMENLKAAEACDIARVPGMTLPAAETVYRALHPKQQEE